MEGWIKLNRQITEHWIWQKTPFSWGQAWVDLLLLANHKDDKIAYKGNIITCKKGTVNRSFLFLAERWHWDRRTVKKFLMTLERDGMCTTECTTHRTIITIVNWDKFQLDSPTECTTKCTPKRTTKSQQDVQQSPTYKNDKNDKNVKNNNSHDSEIAEILTYFNEVTGSRYGTKNKQINELISGRLNDGFTVSDFKTVIKKKYDAWHDNENMAKFIRPTTLFRPSHFEEYLNEKGAANEVSEAEWNPETWNPFE